MRLALIIWALISAANAWSFPIATMPRPKFAPTPFALSYDFEGIVALSNCSGSLVRFEGQPDSDPAYVLTNGHCYEGGFPNPGQFIYDRPSSRRFTLLRPDSSDAGRVTATRAVYVTMTKTDVSLYRLRETYAEILQRFNIRPLIMAATHPALGQPMEVISGYWRRGYSCNIEFFVYRLVEGGWESSDSIRYSAPGCETIGGTSGSPIVAQGTRTVIGVNNTGNESGGRCSENNPCEVDERGNVFYRKGLSYGQQTHWFYSCLNSRFEIDLSLPSCALHH